ncbi:MAG: hypothetical protein RML40_02825 [Bacteroidota bacterium]|nr:hypothetical protein [Candidatus Kapabacteria bacterium]MDW8219444.1 hypothetical protein [Bacteroidota bacterium]
MPYAPCCITTHNQSRTRVMLRYLLLLLGALLTSGSPLIAQATFYSRATGAWSALSSWSLTSHTGASASVLPGATDTVIVGSGHTITLDISAAVASLRIVQGTVQYDNIAARQLTITGLLRIENAGVFTVRPVGSGLPNTLILHGDVVNNGVWTMRPVPNSPSFRTVTAFVGLGLQKITGNPVLTRLHQVLLNKASRAAVVECAISIGVGIPNNISSAQTFDFFTSVYGAAGGTWRQSAGTLTFDDGIPQSSEQRIETPGALHIVGTATMIFGQNGLGASLILDGGELLFNTSSSIPSQIGVAVGNSLLYTGSVDRSSFVLERGIVEVAGRFSRNNVGNIIAYRQSGGTLILCKAGSPSIASRGMFEIVHSASEMIMSGGTIIVRNANASTSMTRPAEVFIGLGASVQISGGTMQVSDDYSLANQRFAWDTPSSLVWNRWVIGNPSATLHPFNALQNLRIGGDFVCHGTFNGTQTRTLAPIQSILTLQGNNALQQLLSGVGRIVAYHLVMNRQGIGNGVVQALLPIIVRGTIDFQEGGNSASQIFELGSNGDVTLINTAPNAIVDASDTRYFLTHTMGGYIWRALAGSGEYIFPVGSAGSSVKPSATYTPLVLSVSNASGQYGVKVYTGSSSAQLGAHLQIPAQMTSYVRRVWQCQSEGVSGVARIVPVLLNSFDDIAGSRAILRLARYRPSEHVNGGTWFYADTAYALPAIEWSGDWSYIEAQNRVFYSRASGLWRDATSWSFVSHTGAAVPAGVFPSRLTDSVIIGGGVAGVGNHNITLDTSVVVGATLLGVQGALNSATTTGTLVCLEESRLGGRRFVLGEGSTLKIGSVLGITALPAAQGNIITTQERRFVANAVYEYIGIKEQVLGTGIPQSVAELHMSKPLSSVLHAERSLNIWRRFALFSGIWDAQEYTFSGITTAQTSVLLLDSLATLRIGGQQGLADASTGTVRGFDAYVLHERSTIELYGEGAQVIHPLPHNEPLGNLIVSGSGVKITWKPCVIRGTMTIRSGATWVNNAHDSGIQIWGTLTNAGTIMNNGVIELGK